MNFSLLHWEKSFFARTLKQENDQNIFFYYFLGGRFFTNVWNRKQLIL
jgi:hypothetical protein